MPKKTVQLQTFDVSLPGWPVLRFEAQTADDAFAQYKEKCGILKTSRQPTVTHVTADDGELVITTEEVDTPDAE